MDFLNTHPHADIMYTCTSGSLQDKGLEVVQFAVDVDEVEIVILHHGLQIRAPTRRVVQSALTLSTSDTREIEHTLNM